MKNHVFFILLVLFISCDKKSGLELEIMNQELISCQRNNDFNNNKYLDLSNNILSYKLTNHDDVSYYFNLYSDSKLLWKYNFLPVDHAALLFTDINNDTTDISHRTSFQTGECWNEINRSKDIKAKRLGYKISGDIKEYMDMNNFIIGPNETIYFESNLNLPNGDDFHPYGVKFNKSEYLGSLIIYSDSTNFRKNLSRPDLKTIKENRYKVFHGVITSKNKVPVKFINCN